MLSPRNRKKIWTQAEDALLITLRAQGRSWDEIANALSVSRWTVITRAKVVGAFFTQEEPPDEPEHVVARREAGAAALSPGHPIALGVLASAPELF